MKKRNSLLVLSVFALVFLFSMWLSMGLQLEENILSLLPGDDKMVKDFQFIAKEFRLLDSLYIDIGTEELSEKEKGGLVKVADDLHGSLEKSGMFQSIHYRIDPQKSLELFDNMEEKKPCLFSNEDLAVLDQYLEEGEIEKRLARAKRRLIEPSGLFLLKKIRRDPLNTMEILLDKLKGMDPWGGDVHVRGGRLWSADGRHILMVAVPRCSPTDGPGTEKLVSFLEKTREKLCEGANGIRIGYVGGHVANRDNTVTIKNDVRRTMAAITLSIMLIGLLFFRQKVFICLVFFPAAFGMALALGILALFSSRLSGIAFGCGALFVGITVDYGLHILFHLDNSIDKDRSEKTGRMLIRPLIMGSGTTVGAFACLFLSSLPGQRDMGSVVVLGVLGAVIFSFFALKRLVPDRKEGQKKWVLPLAFYCERFLLWRKRNHPAVLAFGICTLIASLFGINKIHFDGDVNHLSYLNPRNRADEEQLKSIWGGSFSFSTLVVSGKTLEEALAANDRLAGELKKLVEQGMVSSFSSLSPILPSRETQQQNRQRWDSFWSDRIKKVKSHFQKASQSLGFSEEAFSPFFESLEQENSPVDMEQFKDSGFDWSIRTRIVSKGHKTMVLTTFITPDRGNLEKIADHLNSVLPGSIFVDKKLFVEHTTHRVKTEFEKLLFAATLTVLLILFFSFGRIELVLAVFSPVLLSSVMTLGMLGLLGIPLNLFSILFIIFVFGVGIDFSIFLLSSALSEYRYEGKFSATTCGSVILCALTTICAFATLSFSAHPALFSIGITGVIGMTLSLAVSITFIPIFTDTLLPNGGCYGTPTLKKMSGALWAFLFLAGFGTLYNWFLRFVLYFRYWGNIRKRESFTRRYMHFVSSFFLKTFPYLDSKRIFIEASAEKFAKPSVIVSNHLSSFDIVVILALPVDMIMIVKKWVWKAPFLGRLIRDAGYQVVGQDSPEVLLEKCSDYLKAGVSIMVFPEGTRSKDGEMGRFHKGAFEIAVKTNSPIIPVLLTNTQACTPRVSFWIGDHQVVIRTLSPITPENFDYALGARILGRCTKAKMMEYQHPDWVLAQKGKAFWLNIKGLYNYLGIHVEMYVAWKLRFDMFYRSLDELVQQEGLVFDLGCGYGLSSNILAWKSPKRRVVGVDSDERKINVARRTAQARKNLEFVLEDLQAWESPLADTIVMTDVLRGWNEEKRQSLIERTCQRLKPGGSLVFRDSATENRRFYLETFESQGLKLHFEPEGWGPGVVFTFRKVS